MSLSGECEEGGAASKMSLSGECEEGGAASKKSLSGECEEGGAASKKSLSGECEEGDTVHYQTQRPVSPVPSCLSMKSDDSMIQPLNFSSGTAHPRLKTQRPESPVPSCLSMKSDDSMIQPLNFSSETAHIDPRVKTQRPESPVPSCLSMKSDDSMIQPLNFSSGTVRLDSRVKTQRPESPVPSCLSMKSDDSMIQPLNFSSGTVLSDPRVETQRPKSPVPTCLSMKSDDSMIQPLNFSSETAHFDPRVQKQRQESPVPSCLSMKSDDSMIQPLNFSIGMVPSDPSWWRAGLSQDQSRCEVCEQRDVKSCLTCNASHCRTHTMHHYTQALQRRTLVEGTGNQEQDSYSAVDDVLQSVLVSHKTSLKRKFEHVLEGITVHGNQTLLNKIYTELYITEGEREGLNKEHEVWQIEAASNTQTSQDTAINCKDIFKPLSGQKKHIRTVLTKGIAGIGKTVSVQKFILDWAEGKSNQDVDFMFVLPFRELNLVKDKQCSLHRLLQKFHHDLKDLKNANIYDVCKIVLIFDGLDESRLHLDFNDNQMLCDVTKTSSVDVLITNLFEGNLLPSALIWITSRPAAANQIPSQYIVQVTEVRGFNDPQKEEYFRKKISDQSQASRIISHIKTTRSLHIMCHVPVFCWISATVLQQMLDRDASKDMPKTLTEMYTHFLLIQTNMKNQKYHGRNEADPQKLLESNKEVILKLAELAFKQLENGNLVFYEEDLRECGIDVSDASVYSGMCTELFKEESVLYQRKVYCFVHLSIQEFLAAVFVFLSYVSKNMEALKSFLKETQRHRSDELVYLLEGAVDKTLKCENGQLDLFLRFLLGISLESNQSLLQGLLTHTQRSTKSIEETIQYIKDKLKETGRENEGLSPERCINLFLCLLEMNDHSLYKDIQEYLSSEKRSEKELSPAHCSALAYMLLMSEEVLEELNLKKYNTSEEGRRRLVPAVRCCRKALLAGCKLTEKYYETVASALLSTNAHLRELDLSDNYWIKTGVKFLSGGLMSPHCKLETLRLDGCSLTEDSCEVLAYILISNSPHLRELDLSNNDLHDLGVELLSAGLENSHCKLETLGLSGCLVTKKGCVFLASALRSNPSHLRELDLSYNHPADSGVKLLSGRLEDQHCTLEKLNLDHGGEFRIKQGLKKYACELTLDPNTACRRLSLSEGNRKVTRVREDQPYPDHPERFEYVYEEEEEKEEDKKEKQEVDEKEDDEEEGEEDDQNVEEEGDEEDGEEDEEEGDEDDDEDAEEDDDDEEDEDEEELEEYDGKEWCPQVLCREALSGRCYWEAEWSGKAGGAIAVTYKGIRRVGVYKDCWLGFNDKSWSLLCSDDRYTAFHNDSSTYIPAPSSPSNRVGVYLDWPAGTLSFYHVSSDTLTHLYTFNSSFTEPLYLGFMVYPDSSVTLCQIE